MQGTSYQDSYPRKKKRFGDSPQNGSESSRLLHHSTPTYQKQENSLPLPMKVKYATELPIQNHKFEILETIRTNQVTVISGETGCGKTTQVPQYIYKNGDTNIICTQPRRLACINLAKRVAGELGVEVGREVGYQISMEGRISDRTRISFLTTGVLLQKIVNNRATMDSVSHVILDEVHERDSLTDFTMTLMKKLLKDRPSLKLILMSATFSTTLFAKYFSPQEVANFDAVGHDYSNEEELEKKPRWSRLWTTHQEKKAGKNDHLVEIKAPNYPNIVNINHRAFPVHTFYLWSVHQLICEKEAIIPEVKAILSSRNMEFAISLIIQQIHINAKFAQFEASGIYKGWKPPDPEPYYTQPLNIPFENKHIKAQPKSVLVFLPGINEIESFCRHFEERANIKGVGDQFVLFKLHSSQPSHQQERVFEENPGKRKIIAATNIAESSITIPDVRFVVDFMLCKENHFDIDSQSERLQLEFICQANANQRAGRSGRVAQGLCFRMVTQQQYNTLRAHPEPEIRRCSLDRVCLMVKNLQIMEPRDLLGRTLEPPSLRNIAAAIQNLRDNGALTTPCQASQSGRLTRLGEIYLRTPCDLRYCRLFMFGLVFGLLRETIIIGAIHQQTKSMYFSGGMRYEEQFDMKLRYDQGDESDSISMMRVYLDWKRNGRDVQWCYQRGLDKKVFREVENMERELLKRFSTLNVPSVVLHRPCFEDNQELGEAEKKEKVVLLKYVLAMGFFKNYLRCEYRFLESIIKRKYPPNAVSFNQLPSYYEEADVCFFFEKYGRVQRLDLLGKPSISFQLSNEGEAHYVMKKALRIGTPKFGHKSFINQARPYDEENANLSEEKKQELLRSCDLHRPNNSFELKLNSLFNFHVDCGPSADSINYTTLQFNTDKVVDTWFVAELVTDPTENTSRSVSKSVTRMPEHRPMLYALISMLIARKVDILCDKQFTQLRGVRIDNTEKFMHFPFVLDEQDVALINKFRGILFNLFYNIDFVDFTKHSQSLIETFYAFIDRDRPQRNTVKRDYLRDDSLPVLSEDIISRWKQFAKFSTNQIDEGAPDFLAALQRAEVTSGLRDGFSFGQDEEEDEHTTMMKLQLHVMKEYELLARQIRRDQGVMYCKGCGNYNTPIAAVNSLERVREHQDYAFFLLFMLSTSNTDAMVAEDVTTETGKALAEVPDVRQYIYCLNKKHLLAVFTKQNRYVLHLSSPVGYAFPLIDEYEVPDYADTWRERVQELMKMEISQQLARKEMYEAGLDKYNVGGCFTCKGVSYKKTKPTQFVRHLLSGKHQKAREELENELALVQ